MGNILQKCWHTIKPGTPEQRNTEHRRNSGTPRNSGETTEYSGTPAEHPGIPTEHQPNASGTPRNNGTLHDEEQLHLKLSTQG